MSFTLYSNLYLFRLKRKHPNQPQRRSHHRHRTRQTTPRNQARQPLRTRPFRPSEKRRNFRRHRRGNWIRLGRQPFAAGSTPGRQVYLYLHRSRQLRTLGTGTQPDQRRRRKPPTNPLLPLRPNRHPARDDRHPRQSGLVRGVLRLGQTEE